MTAETLGLSTADVLRQAADRIDEVGLWQGGCEDGDTGGECAVTSIMSVTETAGGDVDDLTPTYALRDHLGLSSLGDLFRWNDAASSVEVVTSQLRLAADGLS